MSIGSRIRGALGSWEPAAAEAYRRVFIDLDDFVARIRKDCPTGNILEIGCGDGMVTRRLAKAFPDASIVGIDIGGHVGRLFHDHLPRVEFHQIGISDFNRASARRFDLVILADVMHHVPPRERFAFLTDCRQSLAAGGTFVFKDWERHATPIHWLCHFCDRFITGDRVEYLSGDELRDLARQVFGDRSVRAESRTRPWINNLTLLLRPWR